MIFSFRLFVVIAVHAIISLNAQEVSLNLTSDLITVSVTEIRHGIGYIAGIRSTRNGTNFCAGALISPSHVLTRTDCISKNIRWVSLGSESASGDADGVQTKVVALLVHPNNIDYRNDFLILELETKTTIKPVLLDKTKSIVKPGMIGGRLGWNDTTAEAVHSLFLQSVEVQLVSHKLCLKDMTVDETNLCSRGVSATRSCLGDKGGAVIVKMHNRDVLVGIVGYAKGCGKTGGMSIYSRVSTARRWIDSVIQSHCMS